MNATVGRVVKRIHRCMGTVASLHVHDDVDPVTVHAAIDATFAELDRLEAMFSTFRPDSEISRINRGELHLLDASAEVIDVLDACTWLEHDSDGAFDIRRPDDPARIDPAGFVKGWAAERAAACLDDAGLAHWYLSVGGDLQARGTMPGGGAWKVGLADPNRPGELAGVVEVVDSAVATSGTAERGEHLWDGRSGARVSGWASLTVVGPRLTWADAFATAAFAMGSSGVGWVARHEGYTAIAIGHDGRIVTAGPLRLD